MMRDAHATLPTAAALPEEQQNRLAQILDDYVAAAERGAPVTPEELLARHPAEADYLRLYLSGLQLFHAAAADDGGARDLGFAMPTATSSACGTRFGDFEIVREIGRGGMGVVYEAEQLSLRRRVALKVLPLAAASDAKQLGRFKKEAQAAAQAQHPNIVPVFAVGEAGGVHYFAMQLIDGESLASLLHRNGDRAIPPAGDAASTRPVTLTRASGEAPPPAPSLLPTDPIAIDPWAVARYGCQAAEALHAAHEYGVVHRDVKPSNLLVDRQGKLWVADFGLARCREGADLTRTGDVCGTMRYMSPEQAYGQAALVDHRTDVYSLGVTLYELATGRHPADEIGDVRRYFDRGASACKPLRHWNRCVPVDLDTIVMKAMAESRGDRYLTAQDLADDLGRFLAGEPILATSPTRLTRLRKWAGRHKRAVAVVACLLTLSLGCLIASMSYVAGARARAAVAAGEARETSQLMGNLLYDVPLRTAEQLAAIPGADGVRRQLLEESLAYYERLTEQSYGDPALGADLAVAYSKIAGLASVMGDREQALDAQRTARRILEELIAKDSSNDEYARSVALCRNNAGQLLAEADRAEDALAELAAARQIQEELHRRRPQWDALTADLAATYANLGAAARQRGDRAAAANHLRAAIDLQEQLLASKPRDEPLLRSLAASYNTQGALDEATNAPAARQAYQRAIDLQRTLVANHPLNQVYQADLARSYNNLGYAAATDRQWSAAQRAYRDAILLQNNLVQQSPLAVNHRRDLAATSNNLGMALSEMGLLDDARDAFDRALQGQRPLVELRPHDATMLSDIGATSNNLAMLLDRQGRVAEAETAFCAAIDHQRRALEAEPRSSAVRDLLARHYVNFVNHLQRRGELAEAIDVARQRVELWRDEPDRQAAAARDLAAVERSVGASPPTADGLN